MLNARFPAGNLGACSTDKKEFVLRLLPEDQPINPSPWYSFQIRGQGMAQVILDYGQAKHRYAPRVSTDGSTWRLLEADAVQILEEGRRVRLLLKVDGMLYVSAQERLDSVWYDRWINNLVADTPDLQVREFGRSTGDRPLRLVETSPGATQIVMLLGRQHPPEVTGSIAMTAFVEALLEWHPSRCKPDADCTFYRDINFVIAPLLNPDGVDAGYWRHNLNGIDLNRDWGPFTQPETQAVAALVDEFASRARILANLDFHSTNRNVFYVQAPADKTTPEAFAEYWLGCSRAAGVYPFEFAPRPVSVQATSKNYFFKRFGVPSITYEVGDATDRNAIRASARVFAQHFVAALLPGARAGDGCPVLGTPGR